MRWTLRILALLAVLLAAYTVWPFVDLYRLGLALERNDTAALAQRVELRSLRPSLARQIFAAYLRLTGKESALSGVLNDTAVRIGAAVADRALGSLIEFGQIVALVRQGLAGGAAAASVEAAPVPLLPLDLNALWTVYASSEYRFDKFYVSVPPALPPDQRFRLRLQLTQWTWKLYDIELPPKLRAQLAEKLINASAPQ
ncbi:MAG TPA: DUF2939 domain-containing protein [Xanthobacteraceae bacterium]|nr:DUF2939 domain-containing protein [Xanthobacteraceae bacterium]